MMDACEWIDGYADLVELRRERKRPELVVITDSPTVLFDWRPLTGNGIPVARESPECCALLVRRRAACNLIALRGIDVLVLIADPDVLGLVESIAEARPSRLEVINGPTVYAAARFALGLALDEAINEWELH